MDIRLRLSHATGVASCCCVQPGEYIFNVTDGSIANRDGGRWFTVYNIASPG